VGLCPFGGGGAGSPSNTVARAEAYLRAKFRLDPFNRLATVHERYRQTDRQTDRTGQRTDSVGRTVLQTVAQKLRYSVKVYSATPSQEWFTRYSLACNSNSGPETTQYKTCTDSTVDNKAIVNYTSPALCTPVTPFQADPIFSERGRDRIIPCAAWRYSRSNDPFRSERVIVHCQWGRKPLPGDKRCGLSSTCWRRTDPRKWATCTKIW